LSLLEIEILFQIATRHASEEDRGRASAWGLTWRSFKFVNKRKREKGRGEKGRQGCIAFHRGGGGDKA
jgi:hypothetical protein